MTALLLKENIKCDLTYKVHSKNKFHIPVTLVIQLAEVIIKVTMEIVPYRSKDKLFVITYLNSAGKSNGQFKWIETPQLYSVVLDYYVGRTLVLFSENPGFKFSAQPGYPDLNPFMFFAQFLQAKAVILHHIRPNCLRLTHSLFIYYATKLLAVSLNKP